MNWSSRKRLTSYLRSSLWIIPVVAVVLEQISAAILFAVDARFGWAGLGFGIDGAKALCGAVITFALSFIVLTFGSLLVAIQVASGQYTPRIIATTRGPRARPNPGFTGPRRLDRHDLAAMGSLTGTFTDHETPNPLRSCLKIQTWTKSLRRGRKRLPKASTRSASKN